MDILAGLYGFKQGDYFAGFAGSVEAGLSHLGHVRNALQTMRDINVLDLQIYNHTVYFDDGTVVYIERCFNRYTAEVVSPISRRLNEGEFYWVPGCVARYDLSRSDRNCIINSEIADSKVLTAIGSDEVVSRQTSKTIDEAGLPRCGSSPGGLITREYRITVLPGDSTTTETAGISSGLVFSNANVPSNGSLSISCVVMLNEEIRMDYSFTEKTNELDCGFTVWNPVKPRVLTSSDGINWSATCPGSICPLIGSNIVSRFSSHYVNRTDPWPDYNSNFVNYEYNKIGYREIGTVCENEPLLSSDYSAQSPYWDKVSDESKETLEGEFQESWEENASIDNAGPYASYCKFKVDGDHRKNSGTRVVGYTKDGMVKYATVQSYTFNYNEDGSIKDTVFTIKDYQYKIFISEAEPSLAFGSQPFPVCHPQGYMIGMNYCGLFWFNGSHILAGKINNFETEYDCPPIVSDKLELGKWYHVCMTYEQTNPYGNDSGMTCLYITKLGDRTTYLKTGQQSIGEFENYDGFGNKLDWYSGADGWHFSATKDTPSSDWDCSWTSSANMMLGLPRFYQRSLTKYEVKLLTQEVFNGVFVADDFEAKQLIANGLQPVQV